MSAELSAVETKSAFRVRKAVFWLHLVAGVIIGLVIASMAVTGIAIAYQRQIIALAERGRSTVPPSGAAAVLPMAVLAQKAAGLEAGAAPASLTLRRDPAAAVAVGFGRERVVFFNPYTGAQMGEGSRVRGWLKQTEQFHRNLLLGPAGRAVTGACTLAFLAMVLSGLYLWWPRRWSAKAVAAVTLPSFKVSGQARDWNWHNVIGFWAAPLFLVVTATGLVMAYPWANGLLFRAAGSEPPPPRPEGGGARGTKGGPRQAVNFERLDAFFQQAKARGLSWQSITLRLPEHASGPFTFLIDEGDGSRPDLRAQLTLDPRTGEVKRFENFASYHAGRQLRSWIKPVHTGEAFGVFGQTLAALSAGGAALLVWTGFSLTWRRFRRTRPPNRELALTI